MESSQRQLREDVDAEKRQRLLEAQRLSEAAVEVARQQVATDMGTLQMAVQKHVPRTLHMPMQCGRDRHTCISWLYRDDDVSFKSYIQRIYIACSCIRLICMAT